MSADAVRDGIYHPHARTRMRAQGMFRLAQGLTPQQVADEFDVHFNSVENWRQQWDEFRLVILFEGRRTGRPPQLSDEERRQFGDLARDAGGTARTLQRQWQRADHTPLSRNSIKALPLQLEGQTRCRGIVASLHGTAHAVSTKTGGPLIFC